MEGTARDTTVLHTGYEFDSRTGAASFPIYQAVTYQQEGTGQNRGYIYSRASNPTRDALEQAVAVLEHGSRGVAFASGMAAITAVFMLFSSGDHVVVSDMVYGGTYRLITQVLNRLGISASFVDTTDPESVKAALTAQTRAVYIESPTNPLLKIADIRALADLCREKNIRLIVDNTFLTPYWQNPIELGADIVVHSATKYLGGHSDVLAGVVATATQPLGTDLAFLQRATGGVLGPYDSWLLMRGIKTLGVRMEKHESNARTLARWLTTLPQVHKVHYPGLPEHPQHQLAGQQARGYGGMISFELACPALAERFLRRLQIITLAISLGGVESLACLPAKTTHSTYPAPVREQLGIGDGLVRLSVGVENADDLKRDISRALEVE